jgi:glycosyltransferase involved in cell wall biosynthesis
MRILFILHSHKSGGAEKHAFTLMRALRKLDHDIFFAGPTDSWIGEKAQTDAIPCIHVPMHGLPDIWSHARVLWSIKKFKIDLVHAHLTRGAFYGGIDSKLAGIPSISTAHSTNTWKHFKYSRRIIAVSEAVRTSLIEKGLDREKIATIYNGVPHCAKTTFQQRIEKRAGFNLGDKDVGLFMAARFIKDKGHDILVRALAGLLQNSPPLCVHLFLAGEIEGPWADHIKHLVSKHDLTKNVHFLGLRDDIAEILPCMDIFVMPSRREAISLAILEACAAGLPVIGAAVGGIPEAVDNGESGLLFPSGDFAALALCIRKLANNPQQRKEMGEKARQLFDKKFTLPDMVEKTLDVYEMVLGKDYPHKKPRNATSIWHK